MSYSGVWVRSRLGNSLWIYPIRKSANYSAGVHLCILTYYIKHRVVSAPNEEPWCYGVTVLAENPPLILHFLYLEDVFHSSAPNSQIIKHGPLLYSR